VRLFEQTLKHILLLLLIYLMVAKKNRVSNSQKSKVEKFDTLSENQINESSRLRKIFSEQNLESTKLGKRFYV